MISRAMIVAMAAFAVAASSGCKLCRVGACGPLAAGWGADCGCAVTPDCCGEVDCGCEPACGCGDAPCASGRSWALKRWQGDCNCEGPKCCVCTNEGCGCEADCACDPGCEVADECGSAMCGDAYSKRDRWFGWGFLGGYRPFGCFGCGGCDGELYWSGWHNNPPRCCDPCNRCGEWVGPSKSECCHFPERVGSTSMRAY